MAERGREVIDTPLGSALEVQVTKGHELSRNRWKINENRWKIDGKSMENRWKTRCVEVEELRFRSKSA